MAPYTKEINSQETCPIVKVLQFPLFIQQILMYKNDVGIDNRCNIVI